MFRLCLQDHPAKEVRKSHAERRCLDDKQPRKVVQIRQKKERRKELSISLTKALLPVRHAFPKNMKKKMWFIKKNKIKIDGFKTKLTPQGFGTGIVKSSQDIMNPTYSE